MTLAAEPEAVDEVDLEDIVLEPLEVELEAEALTADVVVDLESEEVVLTVGKNGLDDVDESLRAGRRGKARRGVDRG